MPKSKSKSDASKAAIAAKLAVKEQDADAKAAHARWLSGSALDMARPLPDDLRDAVAALVEDSTDLAEDKKALAAAERGICNAIAGQFFEYVAQGGDPAQLNMDICMSFNWPLVTHLECGKEIRIEGTDKKPATFGQVMSKISKVWATDGTLPRLYSSTDKQAVTIVKRYRQIKQAEISAHEKIAKAQKAAAKAVNENLGKLTPAELKGRLDEAQRLAAQLEEMYNLTK